MNESEAGENFDRARAYARELRQEADAIERCPEILSMSCGDDLYNDSVQFLTQLGGWSGTLSDVGHELVDLDVPGDDIA
ncbi:MAG: hypothetical protein ACRDN0_09170 [Trebonia sp.]